MNRSILMLESLKQRLEFGESLVGSEEQAGQYVIRLTEPPTIFFDLGAKDRVEEILRDNGQLK